MIAVEYEITLQKHNNLEVSWPYLIRFLGGGLLGQVVSIVSVGALGKDQQARQTADDDSGCPSEHDLPDDNTVDAAGALNESHASGSTHLRSAMRVRSKHNTPVRKDS